MNPSRRLAFGFAMALTLAPGPLAVLADTAARSIDSLIAAERAFSARSVAKGMRPAFLDFLAEDAVIFRPGPINGMQSWRDRGEVPGILEWGPEFVELSGAGDLGFSTGPWVYRASPDAQEADYGHFITVWRRDAQGEWKAALDCGGSHAKPEIGLADVKVTEGPVHAAPDSNAWKRRGYDVGGAVTRGGTTVGAGTGGIGFGNGGLGMGLGVFDNGVRSRVDYEYRRTAHEKNTMMNADRALGWNARNKGWDRAYREVAAGDLRCQRRGAAPTLGADAASAASAGRPRDVTWDYRGNGVAKSWDLGYVYGVAIARAKGSPAPDTSAFVHLWRKDDAGKWRMVIDWEGPFSKR
jgi:ketosteroid isomerase-like protein